MVSFKWIPNAISLARAVVSPSIAFAALQNEWVAAFVLLNLSFASDGLDGWVAQKIDAKTWVGGKIIDPLADLSLAVSCLAGLLFTHVIAWRVLWVLIPIFIAIWSIIFLVSKPTPLRIICGALAPAYSIAVMISMIIIYTCKAFENKAYLILLAYLPIGFAVFFIKRDRIRHFLKGNF